LTEKFEFVTLNLVHKLTVQLKSSQGFGILGLIVIGLLLLAIPLGIYLTRTQQLNKSKAFQPAPLSAPDLSITLVSDKGLYSPGDNVRVSVYVRNEIEAANIYVVKLKFPTDLLNFVSLDKSPSDSFVQTWTQDIVDNTAGSVNLVTELKDLAGGQNSGYKSTPNAQYGSKLADLNFTAKTTGLKAITFDDTSNEPSAIYSAITNANLITSKGPVNIEITTQPSATPAPTPTPIVSTPTPTPTVAPTPTPAPSYTKADPKAVATPYTTLNIGDLSGLRSRLTLTTTDALRADLNGDGVVNNFDRSGMLCALGTANSIVYSCTASPNRHSDLIKLMSEAAWGEKVAKSTQGFLTSEGKFVNREEAYQIALKSGQIKSNNNRLYSEDLW
jgi:hypothetical protein